MLADATPAIGPSSALVGVGLFALALIGLGVRVARGARRSQGWRSLVTASALFGLGAFAAGCLASAFWHFGGTTGAAVGDREPVCEAWWYEISTPGGVTGGDTMPSPGCRATAVRAIGPALIDCGALAVAAGAVAAGILVLSRRRLNDALARLTAS